MRKEFLKAGVPWTYEPEKTDENNPRHRTPKRPKHIREKAVRLSEIKALVEKNDKMVLDYRQEFLNNRKFRGAPKFVKEFVPSWLNHLRTEGYKSTSQNTDEDGNSIKQKPLRKMNQILELKEGRPSN